MEKRNVGQLGFYSSKRLTTARIIGDVDMPAVAKKLNQSSRDLRATIDHATEQMTVAHAETSAALQSLGRFGADLEQIPRKFFQISTLPDRTAVDAQFVEFHRRTGYVCSAAVRTARSAA